MSSDITNALEVWNESRATAAVAHGCVTGDRSYDAAVEECTVWPFESRDDLAETVDEISPVEQEDASIVDGLQREVYSRVKANLDANGAVRTYDNSDVIAEWNMSRSAASHILHWIATKHEHVLPASVSVTGVHDVDEYRDVYTEFEELLPTEPEAVVEAVSQVEGAESYNEYHATLTRLVYDRDFPESSESPSDERSDRQSRESVVEEIAEDLVTVYIDRSGKTLSDVKQKYEAVEFPKRDVVMMEMYNVGGSDRTEKVENVADWVTEWYDDADALGELNERSPSPMGMG